MILWPRSWVYEVKRRKPLKLIVLGKLDNQPLANEKKKKDPFLMQYTKVNSKWSKDIEITA